MGYDPLEYEEDEDGEEDESWVDSEEKEDLEKAIKDSLRDQTSEPNLNHLRALFAAHKVKEELIQYHMMDTSYFLVLVDNSGGMSYEHTPPDTEMMTKLEIATHLYQSFMDFLKTNFEDPYRVMEHFYENMGVDDGED